MVRRQLILDLAECSTYRQLLQARPPAFTHGALLLTVTLLGTAVAWAALTTADLVVRAPGRTRPVTTPMKVFSAARGEVFSASAGGRVVEVRFHAGDVVRAGDVLLRLDTERLDNEIAKRKRTIHTAEEELAELTRMEGLLVQQYEAAVAKARAELAQAEEEIGKAKEKHASDLRLAEVELRTAQQEEERVRRLVARNQAATPAELAQVTEKVQRAHERLRQARLAVDEGRLPVLRQALQLVEREHAVRAEELRIKQRLKEGDLGAARIELANLELEHKQAVVRAPTDGVITAGDVKVGDLLEPGKPVFEIAEQRGFLFEMAVPSEEVGHLALDMPVRIKLDAYDYQKYGTLPGRVCYIAPDSVVPEGQKAVVYLVRVETEGDEVGRGELRGQLKLGMSGQAEIVTGRESLLALLVKKVRRTISLG